MREIDELANRVTVRVDALHGYYRPVGVEEHGVERRRGRGLFQLALPCAIGAHEPGGQTVGLVARGIVLEHVRVSIVYLGVAKRVDGGERGDEERHEHGHDGGDDATAGLREQRGRLHDRTSSGNWSS